MKYRYINADILNAKINEEYEDNEDVNRGIGIAQDLLNKMPSADVVRVIRCFQCVHLKMLSNDTDIGYCNQHKIIIDDNKGFCSKADIKI